MSDLINWAKDLFPMNRSLTGKGVRETLSYMSNIIPELSVKSFPSGSKVFDWEVPQEWEITSAWVEHIETKQRFAQFSQNNLHVVGYSIPVDLIIDKQQLLEHVYSEPDLPDAIPYVTSYYSPKWGFCMSENMKQNLPDGKYHVCIRSKLFNGSMELADACIKGKSREEIIFSSYICHPSMANNELSGPIVLMALYKKLAAMKDNLTYSYRFLFVPETIGAVAYLSEYKDYLKENTTCGFVVSCVGDERSYSHIQSPYGNNLADKALRAAMMGRPNTKTYSFLERGSDERQYCAPGIELPFAGFSRSKYGEYPEYHTSHDNLQLITQKGLEGSIEILSSIVDAFELGLIPKSLTLCEPQLGKRNLYPTLSKRGNYDKVKARMDFLAYCDGKNTIFDICELTNLTLNYAVKEAKILSEHGLLKLDNIN